MKMEEVGGGAEEALLFFRGVNRLLFTDGWRL